MAYDCVKLEADLLTIKREEKNVKKKIWVIVLAAMLTIASVTAFASDALSYYNLGVFLVDKGYEAGRADKNSGSSYARAQVTWSNWINLSTNFLVAQPTSGAQLTSSKLIAHSDSTIYSLPYYSTYVSTGPLTVALRVNAGQTQANYTVRGYWSPNP